MAARGVTVELGGKERRLRLDLNAIAEIGERLGIEVRLEQLGQDLLSKPLPLSMLRVILCAGLRHEDPDLTPEQVGAWVDLDNIGEVSARFFSLFNGKFSGITGLGRIITPTKTTQPSPSLDSSAPLTDSSASRPASSGT